MPLSEKIGAAIGASGYEIGEEASLKFAEYLELLVKYNERVNLTAITDEDEIISKHFVDSLAGAGYVPEGARLIDIGTGAGFPGVPIKILRRDIELVLLESSAKKCAFLRELVSRLGLGAEIVCARAEAYGRGAARATFDAAVSRAVAELKVIAELGVPLLKKGGRLIAYKARLNAEELEAGDIRARETGAERAGLIVTSRDPERTLAIYEKLRETEAKYPRRYPKIIK